MNRLKSKIVIQIKERVALVLEYQYTFRTLDIHFVFVQVEYNISLIFLIRLQRMLTF